jgi:hypothetical protein
MQVCRNCALLHTNFLEENSEQQSQDRKAESSRSWRSTCRGCDSRRRLVLVKTLTQFLLDEELTKEGHWNRNTVTGVQTENGQFDTVKWPYISMNRISPVATGIYNDTISPREMQKAADSAPQRLDRKISGPILNH